MVRARSVISPILLGLWHAIRLPALMLLVILEPVASFVLGEAALLGVLMTLFWKWVGPPTFPFWTMLALSLGFGFTLLVYEALIVALSD